MSILYEYEVYCMSTYSYEYISFLSIRFFNMHTSTVVLEPSFM